MQRFDAIVIGLGAHGSAAALALARRGLSVVGLEAGERGHGLGSSGGRSRMIRRAYFEDPAYLPLLAAAWSALGRVGRGRGRTARRGDGRALRRPGRERRVPGISGERAGAGTGPRGSRRRRDPPSLADLRPGRRHGRSLRPRRRDDPAGASDRGPAPARGARPAPCFGSVSGRPTGGQPRAAAWRSKPTQASTARIISSSPPVPGPATSCPTCACRSRSNGCPCSGSSPTSRRRTSPSAGCRCGSWTRAPRASSTASPTTRPPD